MPAIGTLPKRTDTKLRGEALNSKTSPLPRPPRHDDEIGMGLAHWLAGHGGGCGVQFEQGGGGERQRVFVRVAAGGGGIGFAGGAAQLDMGAEQGAQRVAAPISGGAGKAGAPDGKGGDRHVEPAGIECVAGQQQARGGIMQHDVRCLVPRGGEDGEAAVAKIDMTLPARPAGDAEGGGDRGGAMADDLRIGARRQFGIAAGMIGIGMAVRDDERQAGGAALGHDRVDGRAQRRVAGAAVEQQGAIGAEQQVEERCCRAGGE